MHNYMMNTWTMYHFIHTHTYVGTAIFLYERLVWGLLWLTPIIFTVLVRILFILPSLLHLTIYIVFILVLWVIHWNRVQCFCCVFSWKSSFWDLKAYGSSKGRVLFGKCTYSSSTNLDRLHTGILISTHSNRLCVWQLYKLHRSKWRFALVTYIYPP